VSPGRAPLTFIAKNSCVSPIASALTPRASLTSTLASYRVGAWFAAGATDAAVVGVGGCVELAIADGRAAGAAHDAASRPSTIRVRRGILVPIWCVGFARAS
jgi:hypothetical protein